MTAVRAGDRFGSAAICAGGDVVANDGTPLPDGLRAAVEQGRPVPGATDVVRLETGEQTGLTVVLGAGRSLVVLTGESLSPDAERLFAELLDEVATILGR